MSFEYHPVLFSYITVYPKVASLALHLAFTKPLLPLRCLEIAEFYLEPGICLKTLLKPFTPALFNHILGSLPI